MSQASFDSLIECPSPRWLPEGHSQTIIGSRLAKYPKIQFQRERIKTPDDDFIDLDWKHYPQGKKALVLFHGLEGSSQSHYAQSLCSHFFNEGWSVVVAHFRGCSGELNRLARSYYSGDSHDVHTVLNHFKNQYASYQWYAAGVSMGGNALLKYTGEYQPTLLNAVCGISVPLDLTATGEQLNRGFFGKYVYTPYFLKSMKIKMKHKYKLFPNEIPLDKILKAKSLYEFDDLYTAPIHGFKGALDYWHQCSSKYFLKQIQIPTLILNAKNDPFIPLASLPTPQQLSQQVKLHLPNHGGHAGFSTGHFPSHLGWLSQRLLYFFDKQS